MTIQAGKIGEILYSRSDSDGLIRCVNEAFVRFSGYPAVDLLGKSYRILRDPQTPGAIYDLLWRRLDSRQPAATYLCNRARSGDSHWMFAIVLPLNGGFISLHLPPMAGIFTDIPEIYRESVAREAEDRADPDRNTRTLRRLALARGFPGYDSFVACALAQECAARGLLAPANDPRRRGLSAMTESLTLGLQGQVGLIRSFEALQLISNNMQIVASRLEPSGGPVSAIAENYRSSSMGISRRLQAFVGHDGGLCELAAGALSHVLIMLGAMRMLRAVGAGMAGGAECPLLEAAEPVLARAAQQAIGETIVASARVSRAGAEIRRHMLALDTIRVLGRVECCRVPEAGGLAATIDHLDVFHTEIRARLAAIVQLSEVIGAAMGEVQAMAIPG